MDIPLGEATIHCERKSYAHIGSGMGWRHLCCDYFSITEGPPTLKCGNCGKDLYGHGPRKIFVFETAIGLGWRDLGLFDQVWASAIFFE